MKMTITCNTCSKELAVVEKPVITDDDKQLYQDNISCDADGNSNINIEITEN